MSDASTNRVRLWLRSEKALGLSFVGGGAVAPLSDPLAGETAHPVAQQESVEPTQAPELAPRVRPAVTPPPPAPPAGVAAAAGVSLFGEEAPNLLMPSPTLPPFEAPPLPPEEKRARLVAMDANEVRGCTRCRLCETRRNTVFGEGGPDAKVFFIGEGPGENEDNTGRPFVGKAGQLLDRMIAAMGLKREQVFIANVVKCRPPGNREPAPDEVATCTPYLVRQLEIVRPRVIVTLGRPATQYMLQTKQSMSRMRGQWHEWRGIRLMPTFHPAYVLRQYTEQTRAAVWDDLKKVMAELGLSAKPAGS